MYATDHCHIMSRLSKIFHWSSGIVSMLASFAVGLLLLASAWAGEVDPYRLPIAAVVAMLMPLVLPVAVVLFVADALWWRRSAVVIGIALALSMPSVFETFPVGTGSGVVTPQNSRGMLQLTVLTYNCAGWVDLTGRYEGGKNPTIETILRTDADIVALQEADSLGMPYRNHVTRPMLDSLHLHYPYVIKDPTLRMLLLSKYPARSLGLPLTKLGDTEDEIAGYTIDFNGRQITLFSMHLHSIGLTNRDKELYENVTRLGDKEEMNRTTVNRVRYDLVGKLSGAAAVRSRQVKMLCGYVSQYAAKDVILCGDFNDVPSCYALNSLHRLGLREVYPAVGRGYMSTFNRNRFWFRIDHVLWRGNMRPVGIDRVGGITSDHYALLTTFDVPRGDHEGER